MFWGQFEMSSECSQQLLLDTCMKAVILVNNGNYFCERQLQMLSNKTPWKIYDPLRKGRTPVKL